jgi:hypothetical protein
MRGVETYFHESLTVALMDLNVELYAPVALPRIHRSQDPNRKQWIPEPGWTLWNLEISATYCEKKKQFFECEAGSVASRLTGILRLLCVQEHFRYVAYQRYTSSEMHSQGRRERVRTPVKKEILFSGPKQGRSS